MLHDKSNLPSPSFLFLFHLPSYRPSFVVKHPCPWNSPFTKSPTCVRHKTFKSLLKQPETISNSPMNCGWCGNSCVSGDRNGPTILGNECPDDYRYTIFQCRQQELTNEELNGIKIDEPYGVGADKVESQGNAATKEESPSQVIAKAKGGSVSKKVR